LIYMGQKMRLIKAILWSLPAIFCWQLAPPGAGVEPQVGTPRQIKENTISQGKVYRVTAYCPCEKCCGKFADGITASGHKIQPGDKFAAAGPDIPFGTMLIIPGYNNNEPVPTLDRGGAIIGQRIDVFFDTHDEALEWGARYLPVQVTSDE